jgi:hypothetical protein
MPWSSCKRMSAAALQWPLFDSDAQFNQAQVALAEAELADGLPLVVPTYERMREMLRGIDDADAPCGLMPPLFGQVSVRAVAYQCVLAGCLPAELDVVMAATVACLEPRLNLLGLLTTTGTPAIALAVHLGAGRQGWLNGGTNALGPGHRANACVGRALSLVMRNVAGAKDGVADMATMGQPGKYTFAFAEQSFPAWRSYAQRRGLADDVSGVTVFGASGTAEVLPLDNANTAARILEPVVVAMAASIESTGARRHVERAIDCAQVLLLPPELANTLARLDFDAHAVESYLTQGLAQRLGLDGSSMPGLQAHMLVVGGPGVKMTLMPLWAGGSVPVTAAVARVRSW